MATSSIFANIVLRSEAEVSALCDAYERSRNERHDKEAHPSVTPSVPCDAAVRYLDSLRGSRGELRGLQRLGSNGDARRGSCSTHS